MHPWFRRPWFTPAIRPPHPSFLRVGISWEGSWEYLWRYTFWFLSAAQAKNPSPRGSSNCYFVRMKTFEKWSILNKELIWIPLSRTDLVDLMTHRSPPRKNEEEELQTCNLYYVHCIANIYAVLPVSAVKYLCSGTPEWGREATPTSISIFDFYGIKALWFEFGNDIFTGCKMPRL